MCNETLPASTIGMWDLQAGLTITPLWYYILNSKCQEEAVHDLIVTLTQQDLKLIKDKWADSQLWLLEFTGSSRVIYSSKTIP